ncbi:MAG TPA: hypothetical protein VIX59_13760 [Candidatus Binataceae bacterium]
MSNMSKLSLSLVAALFAVTVASCNGGLGGFSGSVGNTPPTQPLTSFRVLGNPGTPFTAVISDARSSWTVKGAIPMEMVIVNTMQPVRLVATKLSADASLMSLDIISGTVIKELSSTNAPFGTASVQLGTLTDFAPPASPDVRIFVIGPATELFRGLVEDTKTGFEVTDRAPALFLFDQPNGSVDGLFTQLQNFGSFKVNLTFNGGVVTTIAGGPTVSIKQP